MTFKSQITDEELTQDNCVVSLVRAQGTTYIGSNHAEIVLEYLDAEGQAVFMFTHLVGMRCSDKKDEKTITNFWRSLNFAEIKPFKAVNPDNFEYQLIYSWCKPIHHGKNLESRINDWAAAQENNNSFRVRFSILGSSSLFQLTKNKVFWLSMMPFVKMQFWNSVLTIAPWMFATSMAVGWACHRSLPKLGFFSAGLSDEPAENCYSWALKILKDSGFETDCGSIFDHIATVPVFHRR